MSTLVKFLLIYLLLIQTLIAGNLLQDRCIDITFQRQDRWPGLTSREIYTLLEKSDLDADIDSLIQNPGVRVNPWLRMFVPHKHERMMGFYEAIFQFKHFYNLSSELQPTRAEWHHQAEEFFSEEGYARLSNLLPTSDLMGKPISPDELKRSLLANRAYDETSLGTTFQKHPEIKFIACQMMDPLHLVDCLRAFGSAYKKLYNSGNTYNIANGWLVDIMTSNTAAKGGFKLISKMLHRILQGDFSNASFIDDAKQSYLEAGYSEKDATKWSQDMILMSIVHGQLSWESYKLDGLIQPYNHLNMTVAYTASMLSATLDSLVMEKEGHLYTTPKTIAHPCDNGKAYHFLVPWYISKQLRSENYSSKTAQVIPFIFEWGYQIFSTSYGRDPLINATENYDSLRNQSNRLDLMYAGTGAVLGSKRNLINFRTDQTKKFNQTQMDVKKRFKKALRSKNPSSSKILKINSGRFSPRKILNTLNYYSI